MLSTLSPITAQAVIADRLREAHERQRALVIASLLHSARDDRPTARRWA
jgi:hypothetical protein